MLDLPPCTKPAALWEGGQILVSGMSFWLDYTPTKAGVKVIGSKKGSSLPKGGGHITTSVSEGDTDFRAGCWSAIWKGGVPFLGPLPRKSGRMPARPAPRVLREGLVHAVGGFHAYRNPGFEKDYRS